MKNVLILHGTGSDSTSNWFPWLKEELEGKGYKVYVPDLPNAEEPNIERYTKYVSENWSFDEESIIIGHSSGAVTILGLLEKLPTNIQVKHCYLIGAFKNDLGWPSLKKLFTKPFDFELIKTKSKKITFIHSDNDPYCPLEHVEHLSKKLSAEIILLKGKEHFMTLKFPELLKLIQ